MPRRRRSEDEAPTAIAVLAAIQHTGTELVRQTGIAAALMPDAEAEVPSTVLRMVLAECGELSSVLLRYTDEVIAQAKEARQAAAPQERH